MKCSDPLAQRVDSWRNLQVAPWCIHSSSGTAAGILNRPVAPRRSAVFMKLHRRKPREQRISGGGSESLMWSFRGSPSGESVLASLNVENSRPASVCSVSSCSILISCRFSLLACGATFRWRVSRLFHILCNLSSASL